MHTDSSLRHSAASDDCPLAREHLQLLMFVAELEALHMTTSLSAFQSCSKAGLVRTLWRNHAQEPRVSY